MPPVAVDLQTRPPTNEESETINAAPAIDPNAFEIVADTDKLLVACSCSSSSDQPY
jgi:hypothetical protein